jgi:hypothetical protein
MGNRQSYPDITFLPQLAAYFNISIDELIGYSPQMSKEDIRKLYRRLSSEFSSRPFDDVLAECRAIIKKYFSCFPLLLQMVVLLVNHHMLAVEKETQEQLLHEIIDLCVRIKAESDDVWLSKQAISIEAMCYMILQQPQKVLDLLDGTIKPILNLEPAKKLLAEINKIDLRSVDDQGLKQMSASLKRRALRGIPPEELLVEAFALVREAAFRTVRMRPFDVQMLAGIVLHYGALAEMQTGEGKTLAATAPVYLNSLYGKGVHVLTFNDYLAKRDAGWMGPLYDFLGVTCGYIQEGMSKEQRRNAYAADITYLTAKEAGFDYLRSFLANSPDELVQRTFNYALVDEADSILIDEARIPLVIAGKKRGQTVRSTRADGPYRGRPDPGQGLQPGRVSAECIPD